MLAKADEIIEVHQHITGDVNISPYQASLAMFMKQQLSEVLDWMHPDNMMKPNLNN